MTGTGQDLGLPYMGWEGRDARDAGRSHPFSPPLSFPGTNRHPHPLAAQIFNLMKFDSYARFVKSPLYQECLLAEAEGRPLREPGSSRLGSPDTSRKVRTGWQEAGRGLRTVSGSSPAVDPHAGLGPCSALESSLYLQKPKLKPGKSLPLGVEELGQLPLAEGPCGRPLRKSFRRGEAGSRNGVARKFGSILGTPPSPYLTHTICKKAKPKLQKVGS